MALSEMKTCPQHVTCLVVPLTAGELEETDCNVTHWFLGKHFRFTAQCCQEWQPYLSRIGWDTCQLRQAPTSNFLSLDIFLNGKRRVSVPGILEPSWWDITGLNSVKKSSGILSLLLFFSIWCTCVLCMSMLWVSELGGSYICLYGDIVATWPSVVQIWLSWNSQITNEEMKPAVEGFICCRRNVLTFYFDRHIAGFPFDFHVARLLWSQRLWGY